MAAGPASFLAVVAVAFLGGSWLGPRRPELSVQSPKSDPLLEEIRGLRLDLLSPAPALPRAPHARSASEPEPCPPQVPCACRECPEVWWVPFAWGVLAGVVALSAARFASSVARLAQLADAVQLPAPARIAGQPLRLA